MAVSDFHKAVFSIIRSEDGVGLTDGTYKGEHRTFLVKVAKMDDGDLGVVPIAIMLDPETDDRFVEIPEGVAPAMVSYCIVCGDVIDGLVAAHQVCAASETGMIVLSHHEQGDHSKCYYIGCSEAAAAISDG